jgi:hypothetical protein
VFVCAFSLRRESPDMILGDKPFISEVVLSQSPWRMRPQTGIPVYHRAVFTHGNN